MATSVRPIANPATSLSPQDLAFLDEEHDVYKQNKDAWEREERRLYGSDGVLCELTKFDGESDDSFKARVKRATYVNFPKAHVSAVTGELSRKRPMPGKGFSFGGLGEIRSRDQIDQPTFAELAWYNVDGVGADGSELPAFMDAVDEWAQATGHRWLFWEAPIGFDSDPITVEGVRLGRRPYLAHWSPLVWHNWAFRMGELQMAVGRVKVDEPRVVNGSFERTSTEPGYYLLVRDGYDNLGPAFAAGGWWVFDSEKKLLRSGRWNRTRGLIPMWVHYGEKSDGTTKWPAISRSSTMELGQIAVSLMDMISARDYDFWDACASIIYFLGATPDIMTALYQQAANRAIQRGVPFPQQDDGASRPITVYDSSAGAVVADVSKLIVDAKFAEAREQSFQQITSTPDSSGASKEAGHTENKAPLLAKRARYRQQSENTLIFFGELRFGVAKPSGSAIWTTDFDLAPLVDAVDSAFDTLKRSGLKSKTAMIKMVLLALEERGIITDKDLKTVETELGVSFDATEERANAEAKALTSGFGGGAE